MPSTLACKPGTTSKRDHKHLVAWQYGNNMVLTIPSWQQVSCLYGSGAEASYSETDEENKEDSSGDSSNIHQGVGHDLGVIGGNLLMFSRCDLFTAEPL